MLSKWNIAASFSDVPSGRRQELETLKQSIVERKAILKEQGMSGGQQNKDLATEPAYPFDFVDVVRYGQYDVKKVHQAVHCVWNANSPDLEAYY